ncbi:signal peptidase subunit Sec11 [Schizosaccharomyces japonicus yFS275]|uniref:Signal peptidase complex catalytic subunit SEC11 n=1 Tax=Schizosaccharomyces japonicus (strain yFS275 / FY16936) TaxID=402676 RepID=B6K3S0_SCHJY|nr:signal peptidase subunit Sec11 [Schizosaccharomyces japonicus yFS275]EEB08127.1 signal peptidase subunit Sec11 [Schizosaccharomyces japonicus yFS275]
MNPRLLSRQGIAQLLNFLLVLSSAFMGYKTLGMFTNSDCPVVVVLSESMEPSFKRGDILLLDNRMPKLEPTDQPQSLWSKIIYGSPVGIGDIVVYNLPHRAIPIVHRVTKLYDDGNQTKLITKGDNNQVDDVNLFPRSMTYLDRENDVSGIVRGYVPYLGMITILLTDYPKFKYLLLGTLGLFTLVQGED